MKLAAAEDWQADGIEEAWRAGVDIDRLDRVGTARRTEFQGGAADHGQLIGEGHRVRAGQRLHALRDGVEADAGGCRGGVLGEAQLGHHHLLRQVAGVGVEGVFFALGEEASADQEHHAHGYLRADQGGAQTGAAEQAGVAFERRSEVLLDGLESGRQSGENATDQHDGGDVEKDAPIGMHGVVGRPRGEVAEERTGDMAHEVGAGHSGQCGEDQALGDQHAHQADTGRAEREADGDFAAARGGAGEQQGGHVGAGDEQYQGERADEEGEQEEIARAHREFELLKPGAIGGGDGGVAAGMQPVFLVFQGIELSPRLTARIARRQAAGQGEP